MEIPVGTYSVVKRKTIDQYLKHNNLRLGFISRIEFTVKDHDYDEAKKFDEYKLLGVSRIVI